MLLHFTKMEGCGNDYIYVNGFAQQIPREEKPDLVRRLSDRHYGIGGDGVIFINPAETADFEMEMYNADGSRAEMCGNGIRCVAKYVYDRGMTGGRTGIRIVSCGTIRHLDLTCRDGKMLTARVNMGVPILKPSEIPAISVSNGAVPQDERTGDVILSQPLSVGGRVWKITCVSMGNPHTVVFLSEEDIAAWDSRHPSLWELDLTGIGPSFEDHPRFPRRTNTEFVQVVDRRHVRMRVWERGTGETLACGTGSCAAVVAAVLNGLTDRRVEVELPGGTLLIEWEDPAGDVYLTGPAREVFSGTVEVDGL